MGSTVPSRVSLLILHIQAESGVYSRNSFRFPRRRPFTYTANRHRVSTGFYQVPQLLRTDGVHWRESAGTGPEVLKVVGATGAAFSGITMDHVLCSEHVFHTESSTKKVYSMELIIIETPDSLVYEVTFSALLVLSLVL